MTRALSLPQLAALLATAHAQAAPTAPRAVPFAPPPSAEERMRMVTHPYNPCNDALLALGNHHMLEPLLAEVVIRGTPGTAGITVTFSLNGRFYHHVHQLDETPDTAATVDLLRRDQAKGNIMPLAYHPLVRRTALSGLDAEMPFRLALLRRDTEQNRCEAIFHGAVPEAMPHGWEPEIFYGDEDTAPR